MLIPVDLPRIGVNVLAIMKMRKKLHGYLGWRPDIKTDDLATLYRAGKKATEIAKVYPITAGAIRHRLQKAGVWNAPPKRSEEERYKLAWLGSVRARAKRYGILFAITPSDIEIPKFCPALGIRLRHGKGSKRDHWPSIDRVIPKLGYVRGNVWVISYRANKIKNESAPEELLAIYRAIIKQKKRAKKSTFSS